MSIKPAALKVRRNDVADVPLEASEEIVQQLASRGNLEATIEVIETMEEFSPQKVADIYSGHFVNDEE